MADPAEPRWTRTLSARADPLATASFGVVRRDAGQRAEDLGVNDGHVDGELADDPSNAPRDAGPVRKALMAGGAELGAEIAQFFGHPELAPLIHGFFGYVDGMIDRRQQRARGAVALTYAEACQTAGMSPQELEAAVDRDARTLALGGDVARASFESLYAPKLIVLGRCLARGITDESQFGAEWVVARALASIEEPHVLVLAEVERLTASGEHPAESKDISAALTTLADVMPALTAALVREGCLVTAGGRLGELSLSMRPDVFEISDFGTEILSRLRAAGGASDQADS